MLIAAIAIISGFAILIRRADRFMAWAAAFAPARACWSGGAIIAACRPGVLLVTLYALYYCLVYLSH
jgi:hypothetical protein